MFVNENLIYALIDPRTLEVRYIGQSSTGLTRAKSHAWRSSLKRDAAFYSARWIKTLIPLGLQPKIEILEEVSSRENLDIVECFWIAQGRGLGWPLINISKGGRVVRDRVVSSATRRKLSFASAGVPKSAEHRARISAGLKGKVKLLNIALNLARLMLVRL